MLNEPGNPHIEAFDGAVAQKHHLQFLPVETNHTGVLGFEFRWIAIERQLRPSQTHVTEIARYRPMFERW